MWPEVWTTFWHLPRVSSREQLKISALLLTKPLQSLPNWLPQKRSTDWYSTSALELWSFCSSSFWSPWFTWNASESRGRRWGCQECTCLLQLHQAQARRSTGVAKFSSESSRAASPPPLSCGRHLPVAASSLELRLAASPTTCELESPPWKTCVKVNPLPVIALTLLRTNWERQWWWWVKPTQQSMQAAVTLNLQMPLGKDTQVRCSWVIESQTTQAFTMVKAWKA